MDELIARGFQAEGASAGAALLTAPEAERMVESLQCFSVPDVGSTKWIEQQGWIERLNMQGHQNAAAHADEFVKDMLVSHDKLTLLVHELLVMEVWKEKLLPLLKRHLAKKVDSVTTYILVFHEANLANLLEIVLFHESAIECIEEDHLLELVDWCHRQLHYLNTAAYKDAAAVELSAKELMDRTEVEDLEEKLKEVRLAVAVSSVTILRYLTDGVGSLPVGVLSRLLQTHDSIMALVPLADNPPWMRTRKGTFERLEGTRWLTVPASERFKLTPTDAQVWLALNNLVVDPHCRAKYNLDDFRKDTLLRLKRFMNDLLLDQLPVLKDLQRVLDELALNYQPDLDAYGKGGLVIEQVPRIRSSMLLRSDWDALAKAAKSSHLRPGAQSAAMQARMQSMLQVFEYMAESGLAGAGPGAPEAAPLAPEQRPVKLSLYRRDKGGVMTQWSELDLCINADRAPDPVSLEGENGVVVTGKRWLLNKVAADSHRAFPSTGRIVACHGERSAEALLELPAPHTKTPKGLAGVPAGLWVTVGLLAQDGFALQLRLKRSEKLSERDKGEGSWHAYHAIGGAITLLESVKQPNHTNENKVSTLLELD